MILRRILSITIDSTINSKTELLLEKVVRSSSTLASSTSDDSETQDDFANAKPFSSIPGPNYSEALLRMWREPDRMKRNDLILLEYQERFGNIFKMRVPGIGYIVSCMDPNDVQKFLARDGKFPIEPGFDMFKYYRNIKRKEWFSETAGLVGHDGEKWWEFRSKVQQDMMRPKSAMFYIKPLEDISLELCSVVTSKVDDKMEIDDLLKYIHRWSLEAIGAIFLDTRLGCLDENQPEDSDANVMIKASSIIMGRDGFLMFANPFWRYYPFKFYKRFDEACLKMLRISKKYVDEAIDRMDTETKRVENEDSNKSVLTKLVEKCGKGSQIPVVMAMDALFAGIDTTGNTVTMFLYHLATNPEKQELLYSEIQSTIGQNGEITESKLNQLKYLRACMRESMRLFSAVMGVGRRTQVDMTLSGYFIPKETYVTTMFNNLHLDSSQFPNPEEFLPERWLRGCPKHNNAHPFAYIPFAHGPRMCIGRRFAELEMMVLVIKMIQKFKLEYNHEKITYQTGFTAKPSKNVNLKLIPRF